MPNHSNLLRWTVAGRWIATVGIAVILTMGYALFRPAQAQDRSRPPLADQRTNNRESPENAQRAERFVCQRPTVTVC